jgi:hypothetical protein
VIFRDKRLAARLDTIFDCATHSGQSLMLTLSTKKQSIVEFVCFNQHDFSFLVDFKVKIYKNKRA